MVRHEISSISSSPEQPQLPGFDEMLAAQPPAAPREIDLPMLALRVREAFARGEARAAQKPVPEEDPVDSRRYETMTDNAGKTPLFTKSVLAGLFPDDAAQRRWRGEEIRRAAKATKPARRPYRRGRELSDSDLDPNWNVDVTSLPPRSDAEKTVSQTAAAAALAEVAEMLAGRAIDRFHNDERQATLRGEKTHPGARLRARQAAQDIPSRAS